ncbi:MAG: methyltransferase domain-containing protein [Gemmatimonadetes bacterium]|nr:methyltransferase domain-containing protein [Gemmatimonadota bacterium]
MHEYLIEMLECPACHGELDWQIGERRGERVETADSRCRACDTSYPVREGIGVFLTSDLSRDDLWAQMDSWLPRYLQEHPDIECLLMESPLEELDPADQRFRANVLEERGQFDQAKAIRESATPIYTAEHLSASASQTDFVIECLSSGTGPVVDLASGAGALVEEIARRLTRPVVATDFSPSILRRDRVRLEHFGLYDRVSLVAFDARLTPFKDRAVKTMTSNVGLSNIREPGTLLEELRRIIDGRFLSICHFFDEEDEANAEAIRELRLESLYRSATMKAFTDAGWKVEAANTVSARAEPTPRSTLLGAGIDGLPVTETVLEFCVLVAEGCDATN